MNSKGFAILGILLVSAVFVLLTGQNDTQDVEDFLQTPTPTEMPINLNPQNVLGEETQPAQQSQTTQEVQTVQEAPEVSSATIKTSKGEITIDLFPEAAPNTVVNFATKSNSGFYNGLVFHRVEDWVVQGGDPLGNGTGGGQITTELNRNPFIRGSVGVARGGNIQVSNDSQFFITKNDAPWLDSQYTNFGQVTSGLEIIDEIEIGDEIISITVN